MIADVIDIVFTCADIVYNSCVCLFQLAFTEIGVLLQPDTYGATILTATSPFNGLQWEIPIITSDNFLSDTFAGLLQIMGLPANTPLIGSLLYIAIAGFLIAFVAKLVIEAIGTVL